MKKTFSFGKIDFYGTGRTTNAVTVDVEYREQEDGKKEFTASGDIWNSRHTDICCGGQCLDEIAKYIKDPTFKEIYRLWKLYHLNGMHPECEHQAAAGWREKARESVTLYRFKLTRDTLTAQRNMEQKILCDAKAGKTICLSIRDRRLLSLSYFHKTHKKKLPASIAAFYELQETETKTLGWLNENEHPDGLLSRPCPVCGYKYGSSWVYFPIPENDEKAIYSLFEMEA